MEYTWRDILTPCIHWWWDVVAGRRHPQDSRSHNA